MLIKYSLKEFVDEVASNSPAPGGGSIAALNGALGAALLSMFTGLTIGKGKYRNAEEDMKKSLLLSHEMTEKLLQSVDQDTEAFNNLMKSYKLPKETDEQKETRADAIQKSLYETITVPLGVAESCLGLLRNISELISKGNVNAITDAGVAALVCEAGMKGAIYNVKINLLSMKNKEKRDEVSVELDKMIRESEKYMEKVETFVEDYLSAE